jgi:hypothetical protein
VVEFKHLNSNLKCNRLLNKGHPVVINMMLERRLQKISAGGKLPRRKKYTTTYDNDTEFSEHELTKKEVSEEKYVYYAGTRGLR